MVVAAALSAVWATLAVAQDQEQLQTRLGDVNMDGYCNVLDVQATICQALQTQQRTREADIDENGSVDIVDVQNCINTALANGGLLQRVRLRLNADAETLQNRVRVCAISQTGECVQGDVDPETGEHMLRLRVKSAWSIAFFANENEQGQAQTGTLEFPIAGAVSCVLPLPELSWGDTLDLGQFQFQNRIRTQRDIRAMLGEVNGRLSDADNDGNGIPDFADPLLQRAQNGPGVPQGMDRESLDSRIAACIAGWLDEITIPDLVDSDEDGIPDFVEPLITCLEENIAGWYEDNGQPAPQGDMNHDGTPDFIEDIVDYVVAGIPEWMAGLGDPDVIDENGNGIPDYLEDLLGIPGGPNYTDADGDGVPDFAQDDDGDGIPNCRDDDVICDNDCDGDGIPNVTDEDNDNDGAPDYADAAPCNPDVW